MRRRASKRLFGASARHTSRSGDAVCDQHCHPDHRAPRAGREAIIPDSSHSQRMEGVHRSEPGGEPSRIEHFRALLGAARVSEARAKLITRWNAQLAPLGAPAAETLGAAPEAACRQFTYFVKRSLDWHEAEWLPIREELRNLGLDVDTLLHEHPPDFSAHGELTRIGKTASGSLQRVLAARRNRIEWERIEAQQRQILTSIDKGGQRDGQSTHVTDKLRRAVLDWNPDEYKEAFDRLTQLWTERQYLERRRQLLFKLDESAPLWAAAIRERQGLHGLGQCPADTEEAWLWVNCNRNLAGEQRSHCRNWNESLLRSANP
jgi:hypothetical protein